MAADGAEWPGDLWPGYFTRARLHRVQMTNAERVRRDLGLADCGAVAVRPSHLADYSWCQQCTRCFPDTTRPESRRRNATLEQ